MIRGGARRISRHFGLHQSDNIVEHCQFWRAVVQEATAAAAPDHPVLIPGPMDGHRLDQAI